MSVLDGFNERLHEKLYKNGVVIGYRSVTNKKISAEIWRNEELSKTDNLMMLPDYPYKESLKAYREKLRTWPENSEFPDNRPEFTKNKSKKSKITRLAAKQRFTQSERIAARQSSDPIVQDFMDLMSDAQYIDLARQETIQGVQYLEQAGVINAGRADEFLSAPVQPDEEYQG